MTSPHRRLAAPFTTPRAVTAAVAAAVAATMMAVPAAAAAPGVPPSLIAADPSIAEPASDPFYTPPATVPDAPGSLIRDQRASHPLDVAARADKILYTSTTQDGVPVATSATVIEPAGRWQGNGPTPTIVFAPGTRGSGDDCAPRGRTACSARLPTTPASR